MSQAFDLKEFKTSRTLILKSKFRGRQEKPKFLSRAADVFSVILGFATLFSVHLVGDLYAAEILLAAALPLLIARRGKRVLRYELKFVYILMGLWLLGLLVSDAYNRTPNVDRLRGVALIVFFAMNVIGMSILLGGNEKRKVLYFIGLTIGSLAAVKLQPSLAVESYPWKFGYAAGTILLVMLVSSYLYSRGRFMLSASLVVGIACVNLLMNYRSPILILLLTVVMAYEIIPERAVGIRLLPNSQVARLVILAVLAVAAAKTAGALIDFVTQAGYVSEEAQAKNEAQSKGGNLLLGGRPEFVVGLQAALDSPLIGHGSWPKDFKYTEMLNDMLVETGALDYSPDLEALDDGLIPAHSHLIVAWVWAGVTGLIFWLYIIWMVFRGIVSVAISRPPFAPLYMYVLLSFFWDILFSPFAASRRISEAVLIVVIADLLKNKTVVVQPAWQRMNASGPGIALTARKNPIHWTEAR